MTTIHTTDFEHFSSVKLDLPTPPISQMQTFALACDIDADGSDEFILGGRQDAPLLVWYNRTGDDWQTYLIEDDPSVRIEAGGAFHDIDGDGYPDLVAGGDFKGDGLYWWKNPAPPYDRKRPWKRHVIKSGGGTQFHDQIFGDFDGDGKAELVFWNQGERMLFHAPIPSDPAREPWDYRAIFDDSGDHFKREGLAKGDIDGDGVDELLAGGLWFKYEGDGKFTPYAIDDTVFDPRILAADFNGDGRLEVVMLPADHTGRLKIYTCTGDPKDHSSWKSRELLDEDVDHGHSLQAADFNGNGHLDILCAEMRQWGPQDNNPNSSMWILYGDGKGNFKPVEIASGFGVHEAKVGNFAGNGKADIVTKPYIWQSNRIDLWINRH